MSDINIPDTAKEFNEDTVTVLLNFYLDKYDMTDIKVSTARLAELEQEKEQIEEQNMEEKEYNGHIVITETVNNDECEIHLISDKYTISSTLKEMKQYISNLASDVSVYINDEYTYITVKKSKNSGLGGLLG